MKTSKYLQNDKYICECGRDFEKSQSLNAHFRRCLIHRDGKPPIKSKGGGWNKGKTKENDQSLRKMAESLSKNLKGKPGHSHSEETKKRLSEKRIEFLEENPNHNIKWFSVNNGQRDIKVQGTWEKDVAEWLNTNSIKWDRIRLTYDGHRIYTPDFWLPDYNFFIEVKGWMRDRDIEKMKKVIEEKNITIKILDKEAYFSLSDLKLENLKDIAG